MEAKSVSRLPSWAVLALVWLPLAVLYPFAASRIAEDPVDGMIYGFRTVILGGALVAGVWWLSGRLRWTGHSGARFYLSHVATGLAFAVTWWALVLTVGALEGPMTIAGNLREGFASQYLGWNLMLGFLVYGLTAGVSYALREGARAREQQVRAARLDAVASRSQLTALQAQLNPHFLFNTLHSLSVLIRRDPVLAEEALDRLGELLRYALDHGSRDEVLLRDEWGFVENYLAIEKIRLEERLEVIASVDDAALGCQVPPFCLQPLVENAIRHGLNPRPAGGTLWVAVRETGGVLTLRVSDDGIGCDGTADTVASGIGLTSIRTRLAAWEDGSGTLAVETLPGAGFTATVTLPLGTEPTRAAPVSSGCTAMERMS